ncbi:HNH endonuclease signature motif containing protein [Micromonospora sp. NPDC048986]|uniref:HNH endonuclease n=1 Tax=Micromonospora sp. NPDC048986 TaxID=3155644 RepID=UPI003411BB6B
MSRGRRYPKVPLARRRKALAVRRCCYCGNVDGPFWLEHKVPRSRGGTNDLANLDCTCAECNYEKGDQLIEEWQASRVARGLPWPPPVTEIDVEYSDEDGVYPSDVQHVAPYPMAPAMANG